MPDSSASCGEECHTRRVLYEVYSLFTPELSDFCGD